MSHRTVPRLGMTALGRRPSELPRRDSTQQTCPSNRGRPRHTGGPAATTPEEVGQACIRSSASPSRPSEC
jgi:hypothetical protein